MSNIERFTLELAQRLAQLPCSWGVMDGGEEGAPREIDQVQVFLREVESCIHILIKDDLETRIERARRELEFLEGLR